MKTRGYYGIGIYEPKTEQNIGTLWRSAFLYNADFIFTIGKRYKKQSSDTPDTFKHIPLWEFKDWKDFRDHLPQMVQIICVEMADNAVSLPQLYHPDQAVYVLGAEDKGIPEEILTKYKVVQIPTEKEWSMNVAMAGTLILYDRFTKRKLE